MVFCHVNHTSFFFSFQFPISKIPGGATSIINAKSTMPNLLSAASVNRPENSFLEVQNISQKDDKNHLPNSMTSRWNIRILAYDYSSMFICKLYKVITELIYSRIKENSNIANSSSNGVINTIIVSERNLTLKRKTSKVLSLAYFQIHEWQMKLFFSTSVLMTGCT